MEERDGVTFICKSEALRLGVGGGNKRREVPS